MTKNHNSRLKMKRWRVRAELSDPKRTKGSFRCMVSIDRFTHTPFFIRRAGCHTSLGFPVSGGGGGGGGGGGTQVQRGAAPALRIPRKKGSFFKTSACPRFCKRRVLFRSQVRSMGVKIPLESMKYTRL